MLLILHIIFTKLLKAQPESLATKDSLHATGINGLFVHPHWCIIELILRH
jgi:hypothetical protein